MTGVVRLDRIRLICRDADRLADFYVEALGFHDLADAAPGASTVRRLQLGEGRLELAQRLDGRAYPEPLPGWDVRFQHFAMAVPDMAMAVDRLAQLPGWRPISMDGPQQLPPAAGGAVAFKFRDPEGHPLEFLRLASDPPDTVARIDHSAISVSDTSSSIAFYRKLGLHLAGGSVNRGPEQDRLDGLQTVTVEVSALETEGRQPPHVELLCYRKRPRTRGRPADVDDVAATRLIFTVADVEDLEGLAQGLSDHVVSRTAQVAVLARDPDGHLLAFELCPSPVG